MNATMIRLDNNKRTPAAIERCRRVHPKVTHLRGNCFCVTSSNGKDSYTVELAQPNGMMLAACDCQAGQSGQLCYHAIAAATIAPLYASVSAPQPQATKPTKPATRYHSLPRAEREAERAKAVLVKVGVRRDGPKYGGIDI